MNNNKKLKNETNVSETLYEKIEEVIPASPLKIKEALKTTIERGKFLLKKQEQISEMAEIIKANYKEWLDTTDVIPEGTTYYAECLGASEDCAELLYEAGYRKVESDIKVISG